MKPKRTPEQLRRELARTRKALAEAIVREKQIQIHAIEDQRAARRVIDQHRQALHFLLELGDAPADGKWDHATISLIDQCRTLACLPPK